MTTTPLSSRGILGLEKRYTNLNYLVPCNRNAGG